MKAEDYRETKVDVAGWTVRLASYRLGTEWHCRAENAAVGAGLARTTGTTREEAEEKALRRAQELLARTTRRTV